uniref:Uncharacterized protein n=1 Tax=Gopherus agassizii TaxID=38772 RepID=A0A452I282_9SAUR
ETNPRPAPASVPHPPWESVPPSCSSDGGWGAWSPWTECTKSCGEGLRSRARACDSPTPLGHGDYCEGPPCRTDPACRLDGGWGAWGPWSPCPQRCQEGTQFRFRECDNPAPQHGGRGCIGDSQQQRACHQEEAPWSDWSPWAPCSVSCGGGEQIRTRQCRQPACQGLAVQSKTCHTQVCLVRLRRGPTPAVALQGGWTPSAGLRARQSKETLLRGGLRRIPHASPRAAVGNRASGCLQPMAGTCPMAGRQTAAGSTTDLWTPCSVSCGGLGHMTRARGCTNPPPANGGKDCVGPRTDIKYCQTPDCPGERAPRGSTDPLSPVPLDSPQGWARQAGLAVSSCPTMPWAVSSLHGFPGG